MDISFNTFRLSLRMSIIIIWCLLFALLLKRDFFIDTVDIEELQTLKQAETEEYQAIYFKNDKIGYVINRYISGPEDDWILEQEAKMNLNVAQAIHTIELHMKAALSEHNQLKNFTFSFKSPFYRMNARGTVDGNIVTYSLATGTNTIRDTVKFNSPPMLATSRRTYLLSEGLKKGDKKKIPWFDPVSLTGKESILEYRGKESILINGRVQRLHRFIESFSGARVNSWLNDSGVVVKEESPAGFVFLREPKFKALDISGDSEDILSAVAIKIQGKMATELGDSMSYRLILPEESDFDLHGDRQTFKNNILTVSRENIPEYAEIPKCLNIGGSTDPSPYIQSTDKAIQALAEQISGNERNTVTKIKKIGGWIYDNIVKRPVLGLPDALTTLQNRQGDCNEHAALFAAVARASGIPARIVAGVTYHEKSFYYHAWNEVCLGDSWVSIDTTTNQFPADLTHLRFIQGEIQEQVRISGLLGKLAIEPLPATKGQSASTQ